MKEKTFLVIDDDHVEIRRIVYILNDVSSKYGVHFEVVSPKTNQELFAILETIEGQQFAGLLIDQRLGDHSSITVQGIEIAGRIRNINESIPIYILTKYIYDETLTSFGFSIDDSISKNQIINHPEEFMGRLLRSTTRYFTYNEELVHELDLLIKKSFTGGLNDTDNIRLQELKIKLTPTGLIEGALGVPDIRIDRKLDEKIDKALELLNMIEKGSQNDL